MQASLLIKELTFDEIQKVAGGSASETVKFVPNKSFSRISGRCPLPIWRVGITHGGIPMRVNSENQPNTVQSASLIVKNCYLKHGYLEYGSHDLYSPPQTQLFHLSLTSCSLSLVNKVFQNSSISFLKQIIAHRRNVKAQQIASLRSYRTANSLA